MAFKKSNVQVGAEKLIRYNHCDWVGVDLDGTLFHYEPHDYVTKGAFAFGEPIPETVQLVQDLLNNGCPVKVVTARYITDPQDLNVNWTWQKINEYNDKMTEAVAAATFKHIGTALEVVGHKNGWMHALIDDRAVAVETNTGKILGGLGRLKELISEPSIADDVSVFNQELIDAATIRAAVEPVLEACRPHLKEYTAEELAYLNQNQINVITAPTGDDPYERPLTCSEYVPIGKLSEPGFTMPQAKLLVPVKLSKEHYDLAVEMAKERGCKLSDMLSEWTVSAIQDEQINRDIEQKNRGT